MKIDSLFENVTPSSSPAGLQSQQAPKFGRDPNVLEDDKLDETTAGATGSGAVASVSQPMGTIQKRKGSGALLRGISTSEKYPNSKAVKEAEIVEQDIIINPSMLSGPKPGFHNRMDMEGDTVKNSLHTIIRVADDLNDRIENHTQFPEWVSEKIGAIKSMMVNVMDYVISQQERGDDHVIDEFAQGDSGDNDRMITWEQLVNYLNRTLSSFGFKAKADKNYAEFMRGNEGLTLEYDPSDAGWFGWAIGTSGVGGKFDVNYSGTDPLTIDSAENVLEYIHSVFGYKPKKMREGVAEDFGGRKFVKPNFDFEWEEAERYPEFVKIGKDAWIELARKGRAVVITSAQGINNTDAADPDNFKLLHPEKQKRALAQLETGTVEMPIVAVYSDGRKELVSGNTRLTAMMAQDGKATVWAFRVPGEQGVAEGIYVPEIPRAPQPKPDPKNKTVDEDWQKVNRKDKTSGMSKKAVKAYRRENPGSKLQTAVTTKPSKLKKGSKSAKRRKSFCARMKGMKKAHAGAKTKRNPDSPINKALRRWNCESIEEMQHMIMVAEQQINELKNTKQIEENLHKWFKEKWVRFGPDGKIRGDCARGDDSEGKPKCLPQSKAHSLGKKGRASAAARKRREDPNPERSGKAINVATKKKTNEQVAPNKINHNKDELVNYIKHKGYGKLLASMPIKEILNLIYDEHKDWEKDNDLPKSLREAWSEKYKRSINCNNPKGFSQRAHCQGRKKNEDVVIEALANKGQDEIRRIQQMLNAKFNANLDVDGMLGPLTIKSIKKFLPASPAKKAPMPNKTPAVTGKKIKHGIDEEQLDEKCWTGYHKEGNKKMFGKTYPNCVKNTNEEQLDEKCWDTHKQVGMKKKGGRMVPNCVPKESVNEEQNLCPHCGGLMYEMSMMNEKKDACYYKVKSRYKVWPSAYASGALVKCRKKGAKNWGTKSEGVEADQQSQQDSQPQKQTTPDYLNTIKNVGTAALALKDKNLADLLKQELYQMLYNKTSGEPNR